MTHSFRTVVLTVLAMIAVATVAVLGGVPQAIGAALINYSQFDTATKQKVDNTRAFAANSIPGQTILKISGPIATNGTVVQGIDLSGFSGNFIATISGQIDRIEASGNPGKAVQPQLSLWKDCDNDGVFEWQTGEGGMSPNATIPDQKNRSVTVNGTQMIRVYKACHTKLVAFGYASDGSPYAGAPELQLAWASLTLIPIR
jgi:hypothetical protein